MSGRQVRHRSLWVVVVATLFAITTLAAGDADARKKRHKKKAAPVAKIDVKALGEFMGPFKFGMTKDEILKVLARQIGERYAEQISATTDVYKQDNLRRKRKEEIKRIKQSFTEFTGKKTGWDVSIIDDQFGHKTGESMMVYWENAPGSGKNQRRFFFFHEGRLYKMFIALDSSMLKDSQKNFAFFQNLMENRYGKGNIQFKTNSQGEEYPAVIDWKTSKYHMQAIDKLAFYGSFVLLISDTATEDVVAEARAANQKDKKSNAVVDAMLEGDNGDEPSLDSNRSSIDAILQE